MLRNASGTRSSPRGIAEVHGAALGQNSPRKARASVDAFAHRSSREATWRRLANSCRCTRAAPRSSLAHGLDAGRRGASTSVRSQRTTTIWPSARCVPAVTGRVSGDTENTRSPTNRLSRRRPRLAPRESTESGSGELVEPAPDRFLDAEHPFRRLVAHAHDAVGIGGPRRRRRRPRARPPGSARGRRAPPAGVRASAARTGRRSSERGHRGEYGFPAGCRRRWRWSRRGRAGSSKTLARSNPTLTSPTGAPRSSG